jgi:hypothetical protein
MPGAFQSIKTNKMKETWIVTTPDGKTQSMNFFQNPRVGQTCNWEGQCAVVSIVEKWPRAKGMNEEIPFGRFTIEITSDPHQNDESENPSKR